VAGFLTLMCWSLASAPASAPDDLYHLASIWCAHGVDADDCKPVEGESDARAVPPYASVAATCFEANSADSAVCQDALLDHHEPDFQTSNGNWNHGYPPVYYWVMGWLVTDHFQLSILMMRLLGALVVVSLVTWLAAAVPREMRPAAVVPLAVMTVPLGLFVLGSTNPSGWAVASAAVVWLAIHAAFRTRGRQQAQLCVIAFLGALIGAGSRADACAFTAMAVVFASLMNLSRIRSHPLVSGVATLCIVMAGAFFLGAGQAGAVLTGLNAEQIVDAQSGLSWFQVLLINVANLPTLWLGVLGSGSFGTTGVFETAFPTMVGFMTVAAVTVLLYAAWRRPERRMMAPLVLAVGALVIYPLYILQRTHLLVGQGVQPRYLLPLMMIVVGLVILNAGPTARLSPTTSHGVAATLAVSHCVALHVQMRRYISGQDVSYINLEKHREWWWDLPVPPMVVWSLGSIAFTVTIFLAMRLLLPSGGVEDAPAAEPSHLARSAR
jgi:hypothetical protein